MRGGDMSAVNTVAIAMVAAAVAATLAERSADPRPTVRATGDTVPHYAGDSLIRPDGFERWVLAGASMGLGYSQPSGADAAAGSTPGMFHNVYIEPSAYEHFVRTGKFREKTMLAMTLYEPGQKVHPSKQGFFEGDFIAVEVTLKDSERFPGSWAYFNFGKGAKGSRAVAMPRQACQSCHVKNAADDNVFVQFYPTLRAVSTKFDRDKTLGGKASSPGATVPRP
jgi:cytochrome P460